MICNNLILLCETYLRFQTLIFDGKIECLSVVRIESSGKKCQINKILPPHQTGVFIIDAR